MTPRPQLKTIHSVSAADLIGLSSDGRNGAGRGPFCASVMFSRTEQASNLLGSLLLSHLQLVAMARSEQAPENWAPFFVHIDEFQSFSTDAFASLLSEARKFAVHFRGE